MNETADPRPGLQDLPRLLRRIVDRGLELVSVRLELIQAEIQEEAQRRLRRLPYIVIPSIFLILGFMLLNVGLVALLAEVMGVTRAAFVLAGAYLLIGGIGTWWFLHTGGFNPPDPDDEPTEASKSGSRPAAAPSDRMEAR